MRPSTTELVSTRLSRAGTLAPVPVRPPLKWAGGKRQLLPHIRPFYPASFGRYFEPFVGSGAVFFDLHNQGLLSQRKAILLDTNTDLIGCYREIRDHTEDVIQRLSILDSEHHRNQARHYYHVRDQEFNPTRLHISRDQVPDHTRYTAALAAMLIYLNRTGFNGLFRLNAKGGFNVPIGRYKKPLICDADNLRAVAAALRRRVVLRHAPFTSVIRSAHTGDFIYLDPPYAPLSPTAQFTSYTAKGFSGADQERLQQVVIALARKGCSVLLSNSTAPEIASLYDGNPDAEAAGLRAYRVPARRALNSKADKRGPVLEYLITNISKRI